MDFKKTTASFFLVPALALASDTYLTMENDNFLTGTDDDYTHGTKVEHVTDEGYRFMVSQTMYAPPDLRKKHHVKGERPYCGMLLGGLGYEFFQDETSPWSNYGELDFGMIGPAAMCKDTQTAVHKLLNCRKPNGWDDQLHNEFVVNGQWWTKYNYEICDYVHLVPRTGIGAGTIQDFGEVGCDLKVGWNIRRDPANTILFSATKDGRKWLDKLTAYLFVGVDERYYLYNHVLEGTLFGHRDDDLKVDPERFVWEGRCGAVLKYGRFYATYYAIFRSHEYKHQNTSPNYGGIGIGWTW